MSATSTALAPLCVTAATFAVVISRSTTLSITGSESDNMLPTTNAATTAPMIAPTKPEPINLRVLDRCPNALASGAKYWSSLG